MWNEKIITHFSEVVFWYLFNWSVSYGDFPRGFGIHISHCSSRINLWSISRHYQVSLESLMEMNALNKNSY
jgi:hypothetical protein